MNVKYFYPISSDTEYLLSYIQSLNKKYDILLEIGTGNGHIIRNVNSKIKIATDVNLNALKSLSNYKNTLIHCDLFDILDDKLVDLVIFNTPYIPSIPDIPCFYSNNLNLYECQCENCLINYSLYDNISNGSILERFLKNITAKEFIILVHVSKNVNHELYDIKTIDRVVYGERLRILHG
ncbi:putative N6-DNA-methyltransferase, partial [Pseudoloma neurophilia]